MLFNLIKVVYSFDIRYTYKYFNFIIIAPLAVNSYEQLTFLFAKLPNIDVQNTGRYSGDSGAGSNTINQ